VSILLYLTAKRLAGTHKKRTWSTFFLTLRFLKKEKEIVSFLTSNTFFFKMYLFFFYPDPHRSSIFHAFCSFCFLLLFF